MPARGMAAISHSRRQAISPQVSIWLALQPGACLLLHNRRRGAAVKRGLQAAVGFFMLRPPAVMRSRCLS